MVRRTHIITSDSILNGELIMLRYNNTFATVPDKPLKRSFYSCYFNTLVPVDGTLNDKITVMEYSNKVL